MGYEFEEIKKKVEKSIIFLLKNDLCLMKNNANERAITSKLAYYLQDEFQEWHIDCEYNRISNDSQKRRDDKTLFIPDVIVHIRETKNNLLIIEAKNSNGKNNDEEERLKEATSPNFKFRYQFGLLITFYVLDDYKTKPTLRWFAKGRELGS